MCRWLVAAVVVLVLAGDARGEVSAGHFKDGQLLHILCKMSDDPTNLTFCQGYVEGVADAMSYDLSLNVEWPVCFSDRVTPKQIGEVVKLWLVMHVEDLPQKARHLSAAGLVAQALSQAFPCE